MVASREHKVISGDVLVEDTACAEFINVGALVVGGDTQREKVAKELSLSTVTADGGLL